MHTCPLQRASMRSRNVAARRNPHPRTGRHVRFWLAVSASFVGMTGWRALRELLNAIPDSNDDFGLF
ncbi:hypothetical protein [Paraburkholderia fungorum]|uniref:hypothetical protein n=1 Tax=Paraburkholderia fungorum TaxID=134537 RepID=UPI0038BC2144